MYAVSPLVQEYSSILLALLESLNRVVVENIFSHSSKPFLQKASFDFNLVRLRNVFYYSSNVGKF